MTQSPTNPPEKRTELLSAYLDGALGAGEAKEVQRLIETDGEYKAEYERLLKLRHLTGRVASEQNLGPEDDSMWKAIAGQLSQDVKKNDSGVGPSEIDREFICAYHDGEIAYGSPECVAFEQRLYGCAESNRILADMGAVSELVKNFGYRLEESCTVDVCGDVMLAYGETPVAMAAADSSFVEISAWVDGELHDAAIETTENKKTYEQMKKLSAGIAAMSAALEQQAPDVWPAVAKKLGAPVDNVVPLKRRMTPIKVWGSVAAAVALLVFAVPMMNNQNGRDLLSMAPAEQKMEMAEADGGFFAAPAAAPMMAETVGGDGSGKSIALDTATPQETEVSGGMGTQSALAAFSDKADAKKEVAEEPQAKNKTVATEERAKQLRKDQRVESNVMADEIAGQELATLPTRSFGARPVAYNSAGIAGGGGGNFSARSRQVPASAPAAGVVMQQNFGRAEASYDVAAFEGNAPPAAKPAARSNSSIPSSETFLMDTLREDMGDDEIEVILGL